MIMLQLQVGGIRTLAMRMMAFDDHVGHLHWYMWGGAIEDTTEMLSISRPLPSTVIVGVPVRNIGFYNN